MIGVAFLVLGGEGLNGSNLKISLDICRQKWEISDFSRLH